MMKKNITEYKTDKVKLSPPWLEYYHKLIAMFGEDPDIHFEYDEDEYIIKMFVDNQAKADALQKVLPAVKSFGNVKLNINIIPSDKVNGVEQLYKTIFNGNPVFSDAIDIEVEGVPPMSYVMFKPLIVQFYNDNLADPYGNYTGLYQDIAKDLFIEKTGVNYCTEKIHCNDDDE